MGRGFYLFRKKTTLTFLYILQRLFKEVVLLGGLTCIPCLGIYRIWFQQRQRNCWGMGLFFKIISFFKYF